MRFKKSELMNRLIYQLSFINNKIEVYQFQKEEKVINRIFVIHSGQTHNFDVLAGASTLSLSVVHCCRTMTMCKLT